MTCEHEWHFVERTPDIILGKICRLCEKTDIVETKVKESNE